MRAIIITGIVCLTILFIAAEYSGTKCKHSDYIEIGQLQYESALYETAWRFKQRGDTPLKFICFADSVKASIGR